MPEALIATRATKRTRTRRAALIIRISCVRGLTKRQTKSQIAKISDMRNAKDIISPDMEILYPILTTQVKHYFSILTAKLPYIQTEDTDSP
jgi:hypothetical protein